MTQTSTRLDPIVRRLRARRPSARAPATGRSSRGGDRPRRRRLPRPGDRGVSEVVGFILIFGIVVAGIALVQVYGVPATNEKLEFEHSQRALADVTGLDDTIDRVATTGVPGSASLEVGMFYPSRLFFFNPAPVSGTVRTVDAGPVVIGNATADGEDGDYWNGSAHAFETVRLDYASNYRLYDGAPTRSIEHGLVLDQFDTGVVLPQGRSPLIEGRTISLVTMGERAYESTVGPVQVDVTPLSVPQRTVTVSPETGPLTITLPTVLSPADYREVLEAELVANGGYVSDVRAGPDAGTVTIELATGARYDLVLGRVALDANPGQSEAARYIRPVEDRPIRVTAGEAETVSVEVRDRFDNPVSGVTVHAATLRSGSSVASPVGTTDAEGRVNFDYVAPGSVAAGQPLSDELRVTFADPSALGAGFDAGTTDSAVVSVTVHSASGGSGGGDPHVGYGGVTDWEPSDPSRVFAVANGRWVDIDDVTALELSNGQLASHERCEVGTPGGGGGASPFIECTTVDELHFGFTVASSGQSYTVEVHLLDTDQDGTFDDSWKDDKITWTDSRSVSVTDASGNVVFEGELTSGAISGIRGSGIDLLQLGTYESGPVGGQAGLDAVKLSNADWFTSDVIGRVLVTIPAPTA